MIFRELTRSPATIEADQGFVGRDKVRTGIPGRMGQHGFMNHMSSPNNAYTPVQMAESHEEPSAQGRIDYGPTYVKPQTQIESSEVPPSLPPQAVPSMSFGQYCSNNSKTICVIGVIMGLCLHVLFMSLILIFVICIWAKNISNG